MQITVDLPSTTIRQRMHELAQPQVAELSSDARHRAHHRGFSVIDNSFNSDGTLTSVTAKPVTKQIAPARRRRNYCAR
jgi:hypothetical protein